MDDRGKDNKWEEQRIREFYGIHSAIWEKLLQKNKLKKNIVFVGMNPNKNENKIFQEGTMLGIQVFHSSSSQDLLLKELANTHPFFQGCLMTDFFDVGWGIGKANIQPDQIKRKYPDFWKAEFEKASKCFASKFNSDLILIAFGNRVFSWLLKTYGVRKEEIQNLENNIKIARTSQKLILLRVEHPSPANAAGRKELSVQLSFLEKEVLADKYK